MRWAGLIPPAESCGANRSSQRRRGSPSEQLILGPKVPAWNMAYRRCTDGAGSPSHVISIPEIDVFFDA